MPGDDRGGESSGVVGLYERLGDGWPLRGYLAAKSPVADELFGSSVALSSELALVGKQATEDDNLGNGRAWVFRLSGTPKSLPTSPEPIVEPRSAPAAPPVGARSESSPLHNSTVPSQHARRRLQLLSPRNPSSYSYSYSYSAELYSDFCLQF
jgi:FG-GAP repeat